MKPPERIGMFRLQTFEEVSSTNQVVKRAIEVGESEGFAVGALMQTAGYGRQGRTWSSPAGGMYVSCLLRPDVESVQLPTLSLATGLAVRRATVRFLSSEVAGRIQIKWPNDLVVSADKAEDGSGTGCLKLCGISLEAHAGGVCLGIGINVFPPQDNSQGGAGSEAVGGNVPAYLSKLAQCPDGPQCSSTLTQTQTQIPARTQVPDPAPAPAPALSISRARAAVLEELSALYPVWQRDGFAALLSAYESCAYLTGREVIIEGLDGSVTARGRACGVDEAGRLLIASTDGGSPVAVSSGEAHVAIV